MTKKKQTTEVLEKLLNLVPILSANPGITLEELREISGFDTVRALRDSLHRMTLVGIPPFSPSDLLEIFIDDDNRVEIVFPLGLDKPLALTPSEWSAVQQVITEQLEFQSLGRTARSQLRDILSQISGVPVSYEATSPFRNKHDLVEEALAEGVQLEFRYSTLSSKEPEIRRVDPWAVFQHRKAEYVIGYCHLRRAPRFFHLERMENIEILDISQDSKPPEDLAGLIKESPIFREEARGFTAELAFSPALRPALEQYFRVTDVRALETDDETRKDWYRASCKINESIWFRATLRSLGPGVAILGPEHLREDHREELESIPVPELY